MGEKMGNTNLASEFYVMSQMHRLGFEPILTLGNKKDIDIVIEKENDRYTIDVKGLKNKTNWPIGSKDKCERFKKNKSHYFAFVTYLGKFDEFNSLPEVFIVPADEAVKLAKPWGAGNDQFSVEYKDLKDSEYKDAWNYFK